MMAICRGSFCAVVCGSAVVIESAMNSLYNAIPQ
jgi:hypothetical protein